MVISGLLLIFAVAAFTAAYGWDQWQHEQRMAAIGVWVLSLCALLLPAWLLVT